MVDGRALKADEEAWTFNRRGREYVWRGTSIMVDGRAWTFDRGRDLIWRKALMVDEGVWTCCFRKRWGINRR